MLGGEIVHVERWIRDDRNSLGQMKPLYGPPEPIPDTGVDVPDTSEPRDGATANESWDYRLFLPHGTTIAAKDKVTVRGHVCAVEQPGEPIVHMFTGAAFRTEVTVRRV